MELFKVKELIFNEDDFLDDLSEYEDIIPIIQELQSELQYEEISCVGENDCCGKTEKNYFVEIQGFINEADEFITKSELEQNGTSIEGKMLDMFVIRLYKCVQCGKWIIDILE